MRNLFSAVVTAAAVSLIATAPTPAWAQTTATGHSQSGSAVTVEGVTFDRELTLAGTPLKLNGAGVRSKFFVKVYAAGLYLQIPAKTSTDIYLAKGPKRLKVSFLREIDAANLGKTMSQTMSDNLPREQFGKCIPGLIKLGEVFANKRKMVAGESFTLDEFPGKGTVVSINGQVTAEVAEPEFFTCLMYNYFGDRPADPKLKAAMLGDA